MTSGLLNEFYGEPIMGRAGRKRKSPVEQMDGPTPEQLANGNYGTESKPDPSGGNRVAQVKVNHGGAPLTRWKAARSLTDTQQTAIDTCIRLWGITSLEQRTTANYGERILGGGNEECRAAVYLDAKADLAKIEGYFERLEPYWNVFVNCIRFDEPAGVAGSRLGFSNRSAETRALQIVCFVADIIASKEGLVPNHRIRAA